MTGATIVIDDASAVDTIQSVKHRVFAADRQLPVRRQRLVYRPGPRGMDALADDETLGGAGVAQDGTAVLDVLLADLTAAEAKELGEQVLVAAFDEYNVCSYFSGISIFDSVAVSARLVSSHRMHTDVL